MSLRERFLRWRHRRYANVVCVSIEALPKPLHPCQARLCEECSTPVWVAESTLEDVETRYKGYVCFCERCAVKHLRKMGDERPLSSKNPDTSKLSARALAMRDQLAASTGAEMADLIEQTTQASTMRMRSVDGREEVARVAPGMFPMTLEAFRSDTGEPVFSSTIEQGQEFPPIEHFALKYGCFIEVRMTFGGGAVYDTRDLPFDRERFLRMSEGDAMDMLAELMGLYDPEGLNDD